MARISADGGSEERGEAGGGEVLVVGEGLGEAEAAHDYEGDAVDDAGVACSAASIEPPSCVAIFQGGHEDFPAIAKDLPEVGRIVAVAGAREGIAGLEKDERGCDKLSLQPLDLVVGGARGRMPLVRNIDQGHGADGVEEHVAHGWCSSMRAAKSVTPVSRRRSKTA